MELYSPYNLELKAKLKFPIICIIYNIYFIFQTADCVWKKKIFGVVSELPNFKHLILQLNIHQPKIFAKYLVGEASFNLYSKGLTRWRSTWSLLIIENIIMDKALEFNEKAVKKNSQAK